MSRKLASASPTVWRAYRGVSLLYDPPGCAALDGLQRLEALPRAGERDDGRLLRLLSQAAGEIDAQAQAAGLALGLLPASTYHVTLCDGVHAGSLDQVRAERRTDAQALLDGLPDSLLRVGPAMDALDPGGPCRQVRRDPVAYRAAGLQARGHALVVALEPADATSAAAAARHASAREAYAARLSFRLGVEPPDWQPHITLGYFAGPDDADRARAALVGAWEARLLARVDGATARLRSAALYGFTDMATFWRLAH